MTQEKNTRKTLERIIEAYLCRRVKELGGICIKMDASTNIGIPDRLVVLDGAVAFTEVKRPVGGRISGAQKMMHKMLADTGHIVHLVRTRDDVENLICRILGHEKQLR